MKNTHIGQGKRQQKLQSRCPVVWARRSTRWAATQKEKVTECTVHCSISVRSTIVIFYTLQLSNVKKTTLMCCHFCITDYSIVQSIKEINIIQIFGSTFSFGLKVPNDFNKCDMWQRKKHESLISDPLPDVVDDSTGIPSKSRKETHVQTNKKLREVVTVT